MHVLSATVGPLASASIDCIAASQSGTAGTALTLAATLTLDTPRRIIITSAGDDRTHTFTIAGTNWVGFPVTETLTGANAGASQSVYDYASITSITSNHNTASTVQVGTNGVASSIPINLDPWGFSPTSVQVNVTGTVNVTVQQTLDDCNATAGYTAVNWVNHPDSNLVGATATVQGNYAYVPLNVRLLLNSGTGSATIKVIQAGPLS